jgi:hypothetical protein
MTQSYLVTERHAHTWTEVYFPRYGWFAFEPSASRPLPPRVEAAAAPLTDEDWRAYADTDLSPDDFFDEEDLFESGGVVVLPPSQNGLAVSPGLVALVLLVGSLVLAAIAGTFLWFRGIGGLPAFARPYAQAVRLATWCGFGPARSHTPYEYAAALGRAVPSAAPVVATITEAYVLGRFGGRPPDGSDGLAAAGREARRILLRSLAVGRARQWLHDRVRDLVARGQSA